MDKRDPVREEGPETSAESESEHWNTNNTGGIVERLGLKPVIVHVFDLLLDEAVDALAVRPVGQTPDHAQPVRPLLAGEQLLHGNGDFLTALLMVLSVRRLLLQPDFGLDQTTVFSLPPSSLQRAGWRKFKQKPSKTSQLERRISFLI